MSILFNIAITALVAASTFLGVAKYVPMSWYESEPGLNLGSTITTINGSDTLSSSRSVINTNFSNLNTDKIEATVTTLNSLTSATSLASIGTITSGVWNGTTVGVPYGGTGLTAPTQYRVLLGDGANPITVASSTGTSGQFLTSNGASSYPTWTTAAVDQTLSYNWTGTSFRVKNLHASSTSANPLVLNGLSYSTPSVQGASSTALLNDGSGALTWNNLEGLLNETITTSATSSITITGLPARNDLKVVIYMPATASNVHTVLRFNGDTGANYHFQGFTSTGATPTFTGTTTAGTRYFPVPNAGSGDTAGATYFISNPLSTRKVITFEGFAGVAAGITQWSVSGLWNNTSAQITRIDVSIPTFGDTSPCGCGAGVSFPVGTRVSVYGSSR